MIICNKFSGDEWLDLQRAQHEIYRQSVGEIAFYCKIIYIGCGEVTENYHDALQDCLLEMPDKFDHRSLQGTHDHLAAYWRRLHNHTKQTLYNYGSVKSLRKKWQEWLRYTVSQWTTEHPYLVRMVCLILVQQNVKAGYAVEDAILKKLREVYPLTDA